MEKSFDITFNIGCYEGGGAKGVEHPLHTLWVSKTPKHERVIKVKENKKRMLGATLLVIKVYNQARLTPAPVGLGLILTFILYTYILHKPFNILTNTAYKVGHRNGSAV